MKRLAIVVALLAAGCVDDSDRFAPRAERAGATTATRVARPDDVAAAPVIDEALMVALAQAAGGDSGGAQLRTMSGTLVIAPGCGVGIGIGAMGDAPSSVRSRSVRSMSAVISSCAAIASGPSSVDGSALTGALAIRLGGAPTARPTRPEVATAPVPASWHPRPADALIGEIAPTAADQAGARIDLIFGDRMAAFRERTLAPARAR